VRLVGAVLAKQTDEWAEGRRYLGSEVAAAPATTPSRPPTPRSEQKTYPP